RLDHEAGHDAIEHRSVEMTFPGVGHEIGDRGRRVCGIELQHDVAQRRLDQDPGTRRRDIGRHRIADAERGGEAQSEAECTHGRKPEDTREIYGRLFFCANARTAQAVRLEDVATAKSPRPSTTTSEARAKALQGP